MDLSVYQDLSKLLADACKVFLKGRTASQLGSKARAQSAKLKKKAKLTLRCSSNSLKNNRKTRTSRKKLTQTSRKKLEAANDAANLAMKSSTDLYKAAKRATRYGRVSAQAAKAIMLAVFDNNIESAVAERAKINKKVREINDSISEAEGFLDNSNHIGNRLNRSIQLARTLLPKCLLWMK